MGVIHANADADAYAYVGDRVGVCVGVRVCIGFGVVHAHGGRA